MPTMPGEVVEGPWSPEGEAQTQAIQAREPTPYKPQMGLQIKPDANPYEAFTADEDKAQRLEQADVDWKERFVQHFQNAQRYGSPGLNELGEIRDARQGYVNGQAVDPQSGEATAQFLADMRAERMARYEGMKPAESPLDYIAAIGGEVWGAVADPLSLLGAPVKIGTVGWRAANPILSRSLEAGVSNGAMNVAINGAVQAEEWGAGLRDQVDWLSLGIDAAAGFAFGAPFGAAGGAAEKQAADFYTREAARSATPEPGTAPWAPRVNRETIPPEGMGPATADGVAAEFTPQELSQAQEALFGEVVGTRNLTPEQLNQVDDYLNAGKAGDIPQAPPETQGGLTNDVQAVPAVRDAAPAQAESVPPVREPGQPESGPAPAPIPFDRTERQFAPSELKVDAKRFQFKEGGDDAGVTDRLKGVKKWDSIKSGVTLVWEDLKGDFYIADGHQRHGLASRLEKEGQEPKIRAVVLREADGITAEDARAIAAAKNIAEGTGNAIDAAKILRSRPDMGVDLPPTSALVRDAQGLASLSDDAFGMVVNKKVPAGYAAQVGRLAPDPKTHAELLGLLAKEQPDNAIEAESMIRDALEAPAVQSTMEDMFGSAEVTQILFKERAQVLSAAATAIRKDRAAFSTLVREDARLTAAGNKLATQTNAERAALDAETLANLQAQARRKGPIADALATAAKRLNDGESRQVVVRDFVDSIRGKGAATDPNGRGAGAAGRESEARIAARLESDGIDLAPGDDIREVSIGNSTLAYRVEGEGVKLFSLRTPQSKRGQGSARNAMRQFLARTDAEGLPVTLDSSPLDSKTNGGKLTAFYKSLGFVPTGRKINAVGDIEMRRQPDPNIAFSAPRQDGPGLFDAPPQAAPSAKTHTYAAKYRPPGFATVPPGFVSISPPTKEHPFGTVTYDKPISFKDEDAFELTPLNPDHPRNIAKARDAFIDDFRTKFEQAGEQYTAETTVQDAALGKPVTKTIIVTPSLRKGVDWQLTYLDDGEASGHMDFTDFDDLANSVWMLSKQGYTEPGATPPRFEPGADNKPQQVIPGAERISDKRLAEMRAKAPLKAKREQKGMDFGLFGDEGDQGGFAFSAPNHDPATAKEISRAFFDSQPERTIGELYAGGVLERRQKELAEVAEEIAADLGVTFKNPGIKKQATAEEKIGRKGYRSTKQLTDLVRGGFEVKKPDLADEIVVRLSERFSVLDEGWVQTPHGYFDRKISVRFYDGTIGEIQVWEPKLAHAKMKGGGSELYTAARSMPLGSPERAALEQQMIDLYRPILLGLDTSWSDAVGRGGSVPKVVEKVSASDASFGSSLPDSPTSMGSTSVQGSPGASTAQALPTDQSAGRLSQSTNFTGTSFRTTGGPDASGAQRDISPQGIAQARRPQQQGKVPTNRPQVGLPMAGGTKIKAPRLEDISGDLKALTGAPVRQGRLQRAPAGSGKVAGQYDRGQGVIRMREMADFETQTHETAHSLETQWGRDLNTIKLAGAAELEPMAYAGADPKAKLSEGFAEWFRFYVTTPNYARKSAPQFTTAFENMLRTRAPEQLAAIEAIQKDYRAHVTAPSQAVVSADVVSTRRGSAASELIKEAQKNGVRAAIADYASKGYTSFIDKLNPIAKAVDELAKIYEKRTGRALDITSAQDPYRLARLLQDSYSAGHMDLMHGVTPYHGVTPQGPGLADAMAFALGDQWSGWDDALVADFASYLISRRAVKEYDRYIAGEIPNVPGKFTKGDYETAIAELEAAHPNWIAAADMVYQWQRNMLRKKFESGFITQKLYQELLGREDYVPFMRDLTDLDQEVAREGNQTLRNSIVKAFKGSKRSIINPIESMMADAYHFNSLMRRNDVYKALKDMAKMVGPGGGSIVERIPSTQLKGTAVDVNEVLRVAGKEAGLNPNDIDSLTSLVDDLMGEDARATVFRAGEINEKGEPIIYVWENGKKQALRLADGDFGRELFDSMTGMNKEARDLFTSILALPSTALRYSITTAPPFVLANYIRDQVSAWVLTGARFIPFVTGFRGLRDEIMQREITQIYNTFGGIMGGGNVASLDKGRARRDFSALQKKGYSVKRFANIRGFAEFTELTETGTRLGIFKNAFDRARKSGLNEYEAAVEAAYQARDYIDFGRHGSRTHAARRLVTFLNASLQGLDKTVRTLSAEGAIRKAVTPYINKRAGRPLSARDKANLSTSARAWAALTAVGVFGLGLSTLYKDDPEYEEISDYLRATHWMVKKGPGEWYAIPKPFELGFVSNLFERGFDAVYGRNPIAMQSFWSGLYEVTAPPTDIPLFEVGYQLAHNVDSFGRPIVGPDIAGYEPWRQYTARTSEIAKGLGYVTNTSPAMIDHAIQGFGASWGKIITDMSRDGAQERGAFESTTNALSRRFIKDVASGSVSSQAFWGQMSETTGPMAQTANTYKNIFENQGETAARQFLETKDENLKAYAMLTTHFEAKQERLHPMRRAKDAISALSTLRKEIAGNDVKMIEDEESRITLTPDQRKGAQELLARLAMVEARNALVTIGIPGFAQKELMDSESLKQDIATLSPELGQELTARYEKKKIYDEATVREMWPDVKERILTDGADADFSDMLAGME